MNLGENMVGQDRSNASGPRGLTIAGLRHLAAGFLPDTPLLVPRADGEGYEPLVMASAVHVDADHAAATHTAWGARLAYVLMTAAEWERVQQKRAAANPSPAKPIRAP